MSTNTTIGITRTIGEHLANAEENVRNSQDLALNLANAHWVLTSDLARSIRVRIQLLQSELSGLTAMINELEYHDDSQ